MFSASAPLSLWSNTLYKPPNRTEARPVGKCFASKVDDEKTAFEGGTFTDRDKKSATSIIGQKPEMEGRCAMRERELLDFCIAVRYNISIMHWTYSA